MGVQLNIKNPETVRLARELADACGTSMTQAVHSALERAAAEREACIQDRIAKFNGLVEEFRAHMPREWEGRTSKQIMDELYDENGLPV